MFCGALGCIIDIEIVHTQWKQRNKNDSRQIVLDGQTRSYKRDNKDNNKHRHENLKIMTLFITTEVVN